MKGHRSPPEERADSSAIAMDPDDVFSIISNSRRRQVILSVDRSAHPTTSHRRLLRSRTGVTRAT